MVKDRGADWRTGHLETGLGAAAQTGRQQWVRAATLRGSVRVWGSLRVAYSAGTPTLEIGVLRW